MLVLEIWRVRKKPSGFKPRLIFVFLQVLQFPPTDLLGYNGRLLPQGQVMVPPEIMNVNIFPRMTVLFVGSVQHQSQSYDKEVQFFLNAQIYI